VAEEVTLPQLGESVTEGIITQWLVEVGDTVEVDQPLVEISTDKVDTEIPSPVAGVVQELKAAVDDEIEVGQVIAIIGEGEATASDGDDGEAEEAEEAEEGDDEAAADEGDRAADEAAEEPDEADEGATDEEPEEPATRRPAAEEPSGAPAGSGEAVLTSPLVRKMLREAGIEVSQVRATGPGGRITRADAERAVEEGPAPAAGTGEREAAPAAAAAQPSAAPQMPAFQRPSTPARPEPSSVQVDFGGERTKTEPLSRIRKAIARGMYESLQSTAQLTAVVEVDMTRVMATREAAKRDFKAREGASLSPLPIVARAVCLVMPRHPEMNASMDLEDGTATFHNFINLGIAVDTEAGLIVPNIKDAQDLTIPGLARHIAEIADKARTKKLSPDDIAGATFTITNTGSRGVMMDTPILNPPEVGILATTLIEKRPVVITDEFGMDTIAIRHMSYLCLTYDHRMVDGADAARFLGDLKHTLEHTDFGPEVGLPS
jgi:pyruvate dehydrogenase E2 component (dihydrolipoamide acetyltransferase)